MVALKGPDTKPLDPDNGLHQIQQLYSQCDQDAANVALQPLIRKPLNKHEDITLVDDVFDALMDPVQAQIARPVLRYALKEIARAALQKPNAKIILSATSE